LTFEECEIKTSCASNHVSAGQSHEYIDYTIIPLGSLKCNFFSWHIKVKIFRLKIYIDQM